MVQRFAARGGSVNEGYKRINFPETEISSFKISLYIASDFKIISSKKMFLMSEHNYYFLPLHIQN
jgi:hypothetical protein